MSISVWSAGTIAGAAPWSPNTKRNAERMTPVLDKIWGPALSFSRTAHRDRAIYLGMERKNSVDARHRRYCSTTKHITWEVRHDAGDCSLVKYRRSRRHLGISRARALE